MFAHIQHFMWLLWDLPAGSIWSNLVASIVWGIGAVFVARFLHKKTIKHINTKFDEHHEKMKELINAQQEHKSASV